MGEVNQMMVLEINVWQAESCGNTERPEERVSVICTPHRSRVSRRSSGRIKGGMMTVKDKKGRGLGHLCCVLLCLCSRGRRLPVSFLFVFCLFCH